MDFNSSPYIIYHSKARNYTGYIPYKIINNKKTYELGEHIMYCNETKKHIKQTKCELPIEDIVNSSYLMCRLLELEYGEDYQPSYTYKFDYNTFEVGICGTNLHKMYDSIKNIQSLLKNKIDCETDDYFENIKIYISKNIINEEGNEQTVIIPKPIDYDFIE